MAGFSKTFAALSDENRRKILELLRKKDMTPTQLGVSFQMTAPSLSHHLNVLKDAELVSTTRDGQQIYYSLNLSVFEEAIDLLFKFLKTNKK